MRIAWDAPRLQRVARSRFKLSSNVDVSGNVSTFRLRSRVIVRGEFCSACPFAILSLFLSSSFSFPVLLCYALGRIQRLSLSLSLSLSLVPAWYFDLVLRACARSISSLSFAPSSVCPRKYDDALSACKRILLLRVLRVQCVSRGKLNRTYFLRDAIASVLALVRCAASQRGSCFAPLIEDALQ